LAGLGYLGSLLSIRETFLPVSIRDAPCD